MKWTHLGVMAAIGLAPAALPAQEKPRALEIPGPIQIVAGGGEGEEGVVIVEAEGGQALPPDVLPRPGQPMPRVFFHREMKREKGAYLGLSASEAAPALRKQLHLPDGMGLVVDVVVPGTPAAEAGVQEYDVIRKLDDQLLVDPVQLSVLVRAHKPGDQVELTIIREGKPQTLTAKLVEHELGPLGEAEEMQNFAFRVMPEPRVASPWMRPGWQAEMANRLGAANGPASRTILTDGKAYSLMTTIEGKQLFTVKDADGKTIFDGPIDTDEQRAKLSPDMKKMLEMLRKPLTPGEPPHISGDKPDHPTKEKKDKDADEK